MKRLGVYAFICIALIGIWGGFSVSSASAQSVPSQGTYDYFYNQGISILDATIKSLNDAKTANDNTVNEPNKARISATLAKEIIIFQDEKTAYTQSFNQAKTSGLTPAKAQIQALPAAEAVFQAGWGALSPQEKTEPRANGIIRTHSTQWAGLLTQAIQIDRNIITASSTEANSLGNATAVATAGTSAADIVKNNDASKCRITNVSLVDCVDVLFTWIIKNTFLQIAGFLVWVTANMLNFAIQVSVLNFSEWAPQSLYPIHVIIRQIVSLVVVFAGLYLGFMYIIGRQDTFARYVGWLCIYAIFVNFSYPVTRALTDVSNIVSLNIYASAVGVEPLETNFSSAATTLGGNTAGALIMNRLGLQGLVGSATGISGQQAGVVNQINSTPGALITLAFVLYAAYIFFMATAIIATRTAVLVFLIVASPLLLLDSVVPKVGDAAMKVRKMFFEQLIVAPVFMIMLALTLKFMEVFQSGPLAGGTTGALTGGADSIKTFFGILMMLIMLHIMIKVTKSVAGEAGSFATNMMGKVGGFGLGVASGGAGLLARGTIGAAASRLQSSAWMDKMQGSKAGRGLYSLTNSLAQSTFDSRNIGMISKGMASAGMGMGAGSTQTYEKKFTARESAVTAKYESIKDDKARAAYFESTKNGARSKMGRMILGGESDGDKIAEKLADSERSIQDKRAKAVAAFANAKPGERSALIDAARGDKVLQNKLRTTAGYMAIDNNSPDAVKRKVAELIKLDDSDMAANVIKNDPFADIKLAYDKEIEKDEAALELINKDEKITLVGADGVNTQMSRYEHKRQELAQKKADNKKKIEEKREELLEEYKNQMNEITAGPPDVDLTGNEPSGNSSASKYDDPKYNIPAYQRTGTVPEGQGGVFSADGVAQTQAAFASSSFAENMRRGSGGQSGTAGTANSSGPAPKTPSPRGEAATA
jgi:hypothetical protein